ncbi:MAG: hypothetical protein ACMUIG_10275 [Thermoplasmatota archaeon]
MKRGEDRQGLETVSLGFGDVLRELIAADGSVSLTISFGIDSDVSGIRFPGRIGGDEYGIAVRSGIISIVTAEGREIIMRNPGIIPSFLPVKIGSLNLSSHREIGMISGGFSISTPCLITVDVVELGIDKLIFIHPHLEQSLHESTRDLLDYLNEPPGYIDGNNDTLEWCFKNGGIVDGSLILIRTDIEKISGVCPYPVILPMEFRDNDRREIREEADVVFYRMTVIDDDSVIVRSGIIIN